jgi:hypothetical protein
MNQAMLMRSIPALAVIAFASHTVWNDEGTPVAVEKKTVASPRLDRGLYDPLSLPSPPRDPFDMMAGRPRPVDEAVKKAAATRDPSGQPTASAAAVRAAADGGTTAPAVVEDPSTLFQLGATMVSGARRSALINGRVYDIGEVIAFPNQAGAHDRFRLISIERDGVMLQGKSRRPVVVTFVAAKKAPRPEQAVATAATMPTTATAETSGAETGLAQLLGRLQNNAGQPAMPALNLLSLLGLGAAHP